MLTIVRRKGLGNGSTKAIVNYMKQMNKDINLFRHSNRGWMQWLNNHWIRNNLQECNGILRWGYTGEMDFPDNKTINLSKHIHFVNNKPACRKFLIEKGIKCPVTWFNKEDVRGAIILGRDNIIGRPTNHAQGKNLYVSRSLTDINNDRISTYWSEIIEKDREFRVYTFFGRIIMVAEKVPTDIGRERLAWNHFGGGAVFNNVRWGDWPIESCKEALKASNAVGIDFAGVDVMEKDGNPFILEINSAHSLTSEYRQETFAKAMCWLDDQFNELGHKPDHFPYPEHIRTYKSMILPYLRPRGEE